MQNWVFVCSLDNLLQKNVIVFFLKIKFQDGAHLKKKAIFDLFFTFFSYQGKVTKILFPYFGTYLTYINTHILLTLLAFLPYQFCKNYEFIRYGFSLV